VVQEPVVKQQLQREWCQERESQHNAFTNTTNSHDPTNQLNYKERINYPSVRINRIDGHNLGFKVDVRSGNGPFGPSVRVGGTFALSGSLSSSSSLSS